MTPRDYAGTERRHRRRREDDEARDEIIEHAVHDAPIVNRFVNAAERIVKVGGAAMLIGSLIGGLAVALGIRLTGPRDAQAQITALATANTTRISSANARIDSLVRAVDDLRYTVQSLAFVQCVQVRRSDPDLAIGGCTPVPARTQQP